MAKEKQIILNGKRLRYSSCISCTPEIVTTDLEIYIGSDVNGRPYSSYNMQKDYADFDAIAFCVWSRLPDCHISIRFDPVNWNRSFPIKHNRGGQGDDGSYLDNQIDLDSMSEEKDYPDSQIHHYMRFLYRVWQMTKLYGDRFSVNQDNSAEVETFANAYQKAQETNMLIYTAQKQESKIDKEKLSISEKHLEKWFVLSSEQGTLKDFIPEMKEIKLHDQFPCGLFYGQTQNDVHESNRIFNKGAIDLWGVDKEQNICIYELKEKSNVSLGIISELFFYSCVCLDIRKIGKRDISENYRGFDEFWSGKEGEIKAYFLAPKYYDFISENMNDILKVMNCRADKAVIYDAITFNQDAIVQPNFAEFSQTLVNAWECNRLKKV